MSVVNSEIPTLQILPFFSPSSPPPSPPPLCLSLLPSILPSLSPSPHFPSLPPLSSLSLPLISTLTFEIRAHLDTSGYFQHKILNFRATKTLSLIEIIVTAPWIRIPRDLGSEAPFSQLYGWECLYPFSQASGRMVHTLLISPSRIQRNLCGCSRVPAHWLTWMLSQLLEAGKTGQGQGLPPFEGASLLYRRTS